MATSYDYTAADFPSGLDVEALSDELRYDYAFGANLAGVGGDVDACRIDFTVDINPAQEATLATAIAAHDGQPKPFEKKHFEQEYMKNHLIRETWWARSSGATLSIKVEETLYNYSGARLMTETWARYERDGAVAQTRSWNLEQEKVGTTLRVRKVEQ